LPRFFRTESVKVEGFLGEPNGVLVVQVGLEEPKIVLADAGVERYD
jgi:hypothetical protein